MHIFAERFQRCRVGDRLAFSDLFCRFKLPCGDDLWVFRRTAVVCIGKDTAHHVFVPARCIRTVGDTLGRQRIGNLLKCLPCGVGIEYPAYSFDLFGICHDFAVCNFITEGEIAIFHGSVLPSGRFIPLISPNVIAVLLIFTLLTRAVKAASSKSVSGGPAASRVLIPFVCRSTFSTFLLKNLRISSAFFSISCCSITARRSQYWALSIQPVVRRRSRLWFCLPNR